MKIGAAASSSELSPCRTNARFLSIRVCHRPFVFDGDVREGSSVSLREPPTWNRAARLPSIDPDRFLDFFVGDALRVEDCSPGKLSLVGALEPRRENDTCRAGAMDAWAGRVLGLPLLKRGFSCTSTGNAPSSSSALLPPPGSSSMVGCFRVPLGRTYSPIECAGGI